MRGHRGGVLQFLRGLRGSLLEVRHQHDTQHAALRRGTEHPRDLSHAAGVHLDREAELTHLRRGRRGLRDAAGKTRRAGRAKSVLRQQVELPPLIQQPQARESCLAGHHLRHRTRRSLTQRTWTL